MGKLYKGALFAFTPIYGTMSEEKKLGDNTGRFSERLEDPQNLVAEKEKAVQNKNNQLEFDDKLKQSIRSASLPIKPNKHIIIRPMMIFNQEKSLHCNFN